MLKPRIYTVRQINICPPYEALAGPNITQRIAVFTLYRQHARFASWPGTGYAAWVIPVQADAATTPQATEPPGPRLRLRWALAIALAGGLLLSAAFAPAGIWPLAAVGPASLAVALQGRSLRASFCVGLVFGIAFFFPLLVWVINLAWYAWVALAAASAVILGVLAIGQRLLLRLPFWPVWVAGWWVAAEAFRDRWPWGGFPWGRLAMSQAGAPTQEWVAIGGVPLLSFIVALVGGTLAWLILTLPGLPTPFRPFRPLRPFQAGGRRLVLAAVSFAAAGGLAVIAAVLPLDPVPHGTPTAEVAAIQGNVPRAKTLASELDEVDLTVTLNHVAATDNLAQQVRNGTEPAPDLVIWPENSTSLDPTQDPQIYDQIASAAAAIDRPILVGAVLQNPERNAGLLWLPGQGPVAMYIKRQLVPFGEYVPLRGLISKITSLTQLDPVDMTPGHSNYVFHVGQIRLGDVICYEVGFDDLVRSDVADGANLLTVQTNDATFERVGEITEETGQQLAMARIRAVEYDRAVVVASTTGYSAIIAPDGHLITSSGIWQQAELEQRVPLITYTTLAERVGAWPEWVIVALTALAAAYAAARAFQERRARSDNTPAGATPGG
jgi:apolipoprotein N-acyltransferase